MTSLRGDILQHSHYEMWGFVSSSSCMTVSASNHFIYRKSSSAKTVCLPHQAISNVNNGDFFHYYISRKLGLCLFRRSLNKKLLQGKISCYLTFGKGLNTRGSRSFSRFVLLHSLCPLIYLLHGLDDWLDQWIMGLNPAQVSDYGMCEYPGCYVLKGTWHLLKVGGGEGVLGNTCKVQRGSMKEYWLQ